MRYFHDKVLAFDSTVLAWEIRLDGMTINVVLMGTGQGSMTSGSTTTVTFPGLGLGSGFCPAFFFPRNAALALEASARRLSCAAAAAKASF